MPVTGTSSASRGCAVGTDTDRGPTGLGTDEIEASRLHELRNALLAAEAAAHGLRVGQRHDPGVTTLLDGLAGSLSLIRTLTASDELPLDPVSTETFDIVDVLEGHVAVARARGLDVHLAHAGPTHVRACRRRVGQVIENLLANAQRHGRSQDGHVVVDIDVTAYPDVVVVHVQDQGPGLPVAAARHLRRGAGAPPITASPRGLGLALSLRMARAMGGDLWSPPQHGAGARLAFSLPRARGLVLDEGQDVVQLVQSPHDLALAAEDDRTVVPAGGQVVQAHDHVGLDGSRPRGPQGEPVPTGRGLVEDDHLDVGFQQDPQAVGQQRRLCAEGDGIGGAGVRFHTASPPRRRGAPHRQG